MAAFSPPRGCAIDRGIDRLMLTRLIRSSVHGPQSLPAICSGDQANATSLTNEPRYEARRPRTACEVAELAAVVHHEHDVPPAGYSGRQPPGRGPKFPPIVLAERPRKVSRWPVGGPPSMLPQRSRTPRSSQLGGLYRLSRNILCPWPVGVALET